MTNAGRPMLDYRPPGDDVRARRAQVRWWLVHASSWIVAAVLLLLTLWFMPMPRGMWFFGSRPSWMIAIDSNGLAIGPYPDVVHVMGLEWVWALEMFLITAPLLLAARYVRRRRGRHESQPRSGGRM